MPNCPKELHLNAIAFWKGKVHQLASDNSSLTDYSSNLLTELRLQTQKEGVDWFLDLFRISSNIPENIAVDSSEEKRYSKLTDTLLSYAFEQMGLTSEVIETRSNSADVLAKCVNYSLVGDAKAFRLSRTAKNQKDFKVDAMSNWKGKEDFAILVCPIFHLPTKQSQIYFTAESSNVCILTYSHICVLIKIAKSKGITESISVLEKILRNSFSKLSPSRSAKDYWECINSVLCSTDEGKNFWERERLLVPMTIDFAKQEALEFYTEQENQIKNFDKEKAINELLKLTKVQDKKKSIENIEFSLVDGC